jgi:hypothetical protein
LNTLSDISARLDALAQAVDGADGEPTPDARAGYQKAAEAAEKSLPLWSKIKADSK